MARPKAKLDVDPVVVVERLAKSMCTLEEIAYVLGSNKSTVQRRFGKRIEAWREGEGKTSLRRRLWKAAMAGNTRILIHLSKHYLNMHDRQLVREIPVMQIDWDSLATPPEVTGGDRIAAAVQGIDPEAVSSERRYTKGSDAVNIKLDELSTEELQALERLFEPEKVNGNGNGETEATT